MSFLKKKISWYWVLPIVMISVLVTFMTTYVIMKVAANANKNNAYLQSIYTEDPTFTYVKDLFAANYIGELPEFDGSGATDALIREYIAATGDRWANYMNAQEYKAYIESMQGNLVGIGVQVTYDTEIDGIEILLIMPDSPAQKIGLQIGDYIVGVEGKRVSELGFDGATNAIKGEAGTKVKLTILRDGKELDVVIPVVIVDDPAYGKAERGTCLGLGAELAAKPTQAGAFPLVRACKLGGIIRTENACKVEAANTALKRGKRGIDALFHLGGKARILGKDPALGKVRGKLGIIARQHHGKRAAVGRRTRGKIAQQLTVGGKTAAATARKPPLGRQIGIRAKEIAVKGVAADQL